jgi:hypothetical protein
VRSSPTCICTRPFSFISFRFVFHLLSYLEMLQTTMPAAGARGAIQLSMAARLGLRTHSIPHLRTPRTIIQRTFRTRSPVSRKPFTSFTFSSHARPSPSTLLQRLRSSLRSFHSFRARLNGKPRPNPNGAAEPEPQTLGARMKKLSREYGWSALGVYLALSALDFPFCYLLVRYLGTDKIGKLDFSLGCVAGRGVW